MALTEEHLGTSTSPALIQNTASQQYSLLVSYEFRRVFEIVNNVIFCSAICQFGIVSNIINIIIFSKQGLNNTVNISLFGISVSDLLSVFFLQCMMIGMNPFIGSADLAFVPTDMSYLLAGWPHGCFASVTCWITLYVSAERCLCIALPLKIKSILTPGRTRFIVILIFILIILGNIPEYATVYYDWKFYPKKNRSLLALAYRSSRATWEGKGYIIHVCLRVTGVSCVTILTSVLVIRLKHMSNWRRKTISQAAVTETTSARDKRTISMVILIAAILVACYIPAVMLSLLAVFMPDFDVDGKYANLFTIIWPAAYIFEGLNSSLNILIYYKMSTKYREQFHSYFSWICSCVFRSAGAVPLEANNQ